MHEELFAALKMVRDNAAVDDQPDDWEGPAGYLLDAETMHRVHSVLEQDHAPGLTPEDRAIAAFLLRREADRLLDRVECGDSDEVRAAFNSTAARCFAAAERFGRTESSAPDTAETCRHCGESLARSNHDGAWVHASDGSRICYPDDGEIVRVAEPRP